jgi:hypothetical protein
MEAARRLKVNYKTILTKIERYGIGAWDSKVDPPSSVQG